MALRMGWVVEDPPAPRRPAPFGEELLGRRRTAEADHMVELAPDGPGTAFLLWRSPDAKRVKNRMHVDLVPDDQDAEVARALRLGATRVDIGQGEVGHVVLADP